MVVGECVRGCVWGGGLRGSGGGGCSWRASFHEPATARPFCHRPPGACDLTTTPLEPTFDLLVVLQRHFATRFLRGLR